VWTVGNVLVGLWTGVRLWGWSGGWTEGTGLVCGLRWIEGNRLGGGWTGRTEGNRLVGGWTEGNGVWTVGNVLVGLWTGVGLLGMEWWVEWMDWSGGFVDWFGQRGKKWWVDGLGWTEGNDSTYLEIFNWDVMQLFFISTDDSSLRKKVS
jgi:hypothetical protein